MHNKKIRIILKRLRIVKFAKQHFKMQESYPVVGKVPTHILTWGKWIEESLNDQKEIVICITGNPGLPGFYTQFLSTIHECLNKELPVWVIGEVNLGILGR